jgi:hypothetical protein
LMNNNNFIKSQQILRTQKVYNRTKRAKALTATTI